MKVYVLTFNDINGEHYAEVFNYKTQAIGFAINHAVGEKHVDSEEQIDAMVDNLRDYLHYAFYSIGVEYEILESKLN